MSKELLKEWTTEAYGLLDSTYDEQRIKRLDSAILNLSKVGITDLVIYRVEEDAVTVRYINRGSRTFEKVAI